MYKIDRRGGPGGAKNRSLGQTPKLIGGEAGESENRRKLPTWFKETVGITL